MGGAAIKREATEEEGDGKAEGAGKAGGARQVLASLQQGFLNGQTVVVALEGREIKKVNGSWFYRQQLNFKFTQEAVEEDEGSFYQSMGDVSQGDNNVDALDMVDNDEGDGKVEGEGDKEGQANNEGQMDPFQVHLISP